ncbi:recombination regulator RecX [Streptococcus dentasini]
MKITKIEKKKHLYLLELDNQESLYITEDTIVHFMLSKQMEISDEQLKKIQSFSQFSYGKNLALYFLSFKPRTQREVKNYLAQHNLSELNVLKVLDNLKEECWIDDYQYAENFINQNFYTGDKGPFILSQKLQQKGITRAVCETILAEKDFFDLAQRVGQKLFRKYEGRYPTKATKDKVQQSLLQKGFDTSTVRAVIDELNIQKNSRRDMTLICRELDKLYPKYQKKYSDYKLKQHLIQALARKGYDYSDIESALRDYL